MTEAQVRSWMLTFGIDLEAHAALNGDASVDAMLTRIATSINNGERTEAELVRSLIIAAADAGLDPTDGIEELFLKRGLTVGDVFQLTGVAGLDLGGVSTDDAALAALETALLNGVLNIDELQLALDGLEPTPVLDPVLDPGVGDPALPDTPDPIVVPEVETVDPFELATLLFPFMPRELLDVWVDAWVETGDASLATATMRADSLYDEFFPGIRRDDGTLRMTEAEYLATIEGYTIELLGFGLNPEFFEDQFVSAIENGLSVSEVGSRLAGAFDAIVEALPEIRDYYVNTLGIDASDEAIFASFINPEIDTAVIERNVSVAQIGGAAAVAGFDLGITDAERLAGIGLGLGGALQFFGQASGQVPVLENLASRFGTSARDGSADFSLNNFMDAALFGNAFQQRRIDRLLRQEAAGFRGSSGFSRDQLGGVSGLAVR